MSEKLPTFSTIGDDPYVYEKGVPEIRELLAQQERLAEPYKDNVGKIPKDIADKLAEIGRQISLHGKS